jgi:hypothetical protein
MDDQPQDSGDGDGWKAHPRDNEKGKGKPIGSPEKGEHRECSRACQEDARQWAGFAWQWSNKLHCLHHPKGCPVCREYCHHLLEAEMEQDDNYVTAEVDQHDNVKFYKSKMTGYIEDLNDAEARICDLKEEICRLEDQLARPQDYGDCHGGKRAHHTSPMGYGSGMDSPLMQLTEERVTLASWSVPTYASTAQVLPRIHSQKDVEMENGEVGRYPPLPAAGQPYTLEQGALMFSQGAN